jgi:predicted transcriptional regulator
VFEGVYGCPNRLFVGVFLHKQLFKTSVFEKFFRLKRYFHRRKKIYFIDGNKRFLNSIFYYINMFGWIFKKKEVEKIKEDTKKGFEDVKKDISSITGWIKHLDSEKNLHEKEIFNIKEILLTIKEEIEGVKNVVSIMGDIKTNRVFKTPKQLFNKQTAVYDVQTAVQTAVQTPNLNMFSITERAIIWVLLNTDMKLSYDDIASMLGKEKSTIRGQINSIKQKSESLIEENIEKNGKKRIFIPEELKEKILKKSKVRVGTIKKDKKNEKE